MLKADYKTANSPGYIVYKRNVQQSNLSQPATLDQWLLFMTVQLTA